MNYSILFIINFLLLTIISGDNTEMNVQQNYKSVYDIQINHATGKSIDLEQYRGKPLLIVNVASKCGFTSQYKALQDLHVKYAPRGTCCYWYSNK